MSWTNQFKVSLLKTSLCPTRKNLCSQCQTSTTKIHRKSLLLTLKIRALFEDYRQLYGKDKYKMRKWTKRKLSWKKRIKFRKTLNYHFQISISWMIHLIANGKYWESASLVCRTGTWKYWISDKSEKGGTRIKKYLMIAEKSLRKIDWG